MKIITIFFLILTLIIPVMSFADHEIVIEYPKELKIHMEPKTLQIGSHTVEADIPITYSETINGLLWQQLESLCKKSAIQMDRYSEMDDIAIRVASTFRVTGTSWAGFQFTARIYQTKLSEHKNFEYEETLWLDYCVSSYDMAAETELTVTDVFANDETIRRLSDEIVDFLNHYYPSLPHNDDVISAAARVDSLKNMTFLPGAGRFILHFPLWQIVENKYQIAPFVIYYSDWKDSMTMRAQQQTDNSKRPVIALTYDDGPSLGLTKKLLQSLDCYGASATFFPIGRQIDKWADAVRCEMDAGHSIGCHTMNHQYAHRVYRDEALFTDREECIKQHLHEFGIEPKLFRAPGGSEKKFLLYKVGWVVVHWSQTAGDTGNSPYKRTATRIANQAENGNIILMHDIQKNSIKAADLYLAELYERGFMFATVEELLSINGIVPEPNHIYSTGFGIDTVREKINGFDEE